MSLSTAIPLTFFKAVSVSLYLRLTVKWSLEVNFLIWHEIDVPCGLPVGAHIWLWWDPAQ